MLFPHGSTAGEADDTNIVADEPAATFLHNSSEDVAVAPKEIFSAILRHGPKTSSMYPFAEVVKQGFPLADNCSRKDEVCENYLKKVFNVETGNLGESIPERLEPLAKHFVDKMFLEYPSSCSGKIKVMHSKAARAQELAKCITDDLARRSSPQLQVFPEQHEDDSIAETVQVPKPGNGEMVPVSMYGAPYEKTRTLLVQAISGEISAEDANLLHERFPKEMPKQILERITDAANIASEILKPILREDVTTFCDRRVNSEDGSVDGVQDKKLSANEQLTRATHLQKLAQHLLNARIAAGHEIDADAQPELGALQEKYGNDLEKKLEEAHLVAERVFDLARRSDYNLKRSGCRMICDIKDEIKAQSKEAQNHALDRDGSLVGSTFRVTHDPNMVMMCRWVANLLGQDIKHDEFFPFMTAVVIAALPSGNVRIKAFYPSLAGMARGEYLAQSMLKGSEYHELSLDTFNDKTEIFLGSLADVNEDP